MTGWWRRRSLHTRLSLLVTTAVGAAVVGFAVAAWVAVEELQQHRLSAELTADAAAIAAQHTTRPRPGPPPPGRGGGRPPHVLGPRWQVLDARGTVVNAPDEPLPITSKAHGVATARHHAVQERVRIGRDNYQMLTMPIGDGGAVQVAVDLDDSSRTLTLLALLLAGGCVIGIAGAAFAGRAVARAGLQPVERLTEAVEVVAATTDLTKPIEVRGDDEIARLGRSVNTMLAAIDTARRSQRALVEDAGHELRTPLTSIRTNVELLLTVERQPGLAHRLPAEEREKLLSDLDAQVRELATLTTELVELAREDTTREAAEELELAGVITQAVNRVRTRAPGLTFVTELQPVAVLGRPGELERMAVNVLDNAAKWSPPGGSVRVTLTGDGPQWCRFTVTDTGPGIAEDDLPYVFDRFYRAAAARAMPGSGLGLAIVAQTASQHGGLVKAGPNEPHGTVLTVRLPRTA
ncbi:sensor histidine kinase [Paractinoplanes rishiriensis]|uniref:histidine kinase n=1 Tax=Paractinoplanes rishiriensis TaxID=1050105 RepID=A0A919K3L4_9ACTN|nr:HAMP domain-containing sensor histidine kinase [Actinoplanes rishiriensis]GIE98657.1 hypothetical protein Ari01nite_61220 [Actinoplanes rishiriensis]